MKTSSSAAAGTGVRGPDCCVPAKLTGSPRMAVTPAAALNRSNRRREKLFLSSAIESPLGREPEVYSPLSRCDYVPILFLLALMVEEGYDSRVIHFQEQPSGYRIWNEFD